MFVCNYPRTFIAVTKVYLFRRRELGNRESLVFSGICSPKIEWFEVLTGNQGSQQELGNKNIRILYELDKTSKL